MKTPSLIFASLMLAAYIPGVSAQNLAVPALPVPVAKPVFTEDAYKADAESLELAAKALETQARAHEALELAIIAWEAVNDDSAWDGVARNSARETASEALEVAEGMRLKASQVRNGPKEKKRTGIAAKLIGPIPELEGFVRAGELSDLLQNVASDAKALAMRSEGYMMKAQANAKEEYPQLWERAAQEWGVTRTLFIAAELESKTAAESFQKTRNMYYAGITQKAHENNYVKPRADSSYNK